MRALTRSASLVRCAAGSAPTTAALHHPAPGAGPCLAKACCKRSLTGDEKTCFLTHDDLKKTITDLKIKNEKAINDMNHKFKTSLLEQKRSMDMAMLQLKCELRKDATDKHNKHCLDNAGLKNELKILGLKFESHKLKINHLMTQGIIMKNFGWGAGAGTAILARFTNLRKILYKTSGKD